jgi:hypothetical protein
MALSKLARDAIEEAAIAAHEAGSKAQALQNMANRITAEGLEAYVIEVSIARAEAIAAQRVLESLIRAA